jgi:hypothetical protein
LAVLDVYLTVNPGPLTRCNEESGSCTECSMRAHRRLRSVAPPTRSRSLGQRASETPPLPLKPPTAVLFPRKANCYYPTRIVLDLSPLRLTKLMNERAPQVFTPRRCLSAILNSCSANLQHATRQFSEATFWLKEVTAQRHFRLILLELHSPTR